MPKEAVISSLYNEERTILAVSTDFHSVRKWVKIYAAEDIGIYQHKDGCKLNITYYNKLQSSSSFQTIADIIKIIKHWNTLKKQEDRVQFYINDNYVGDSVQQAVAWYEDQQYTGNLSENPY